MRVVGNLYATKLKMLLECLGAIGNFDRLETNYLIALFSLSRLMICVQ